MDDSWQVGVGGGEDVDALPRRQHRAAIAVEHLHPRFEGGPTEHRAALHRDVDGEDLADRDRPEVEVGGVGRRDPYEPGAVYPRTGGQGLGTVAALELGAVVEALHRVRPADVERRVRRQLDVEIRSLTTTGVAETTNGHAHVVGLANARL